MKTKKSNLKTRYENACNEYVILFCQKQEMDFEGWVGLDIGGIACCNDLFFNFHDIVIDIDSCQKKGLIVDWYYSNLENTSNTINYFSYTKGLRITPTHLKTAPQKEKVSEEEIKKLKDKLQWYMDKETRNLPKAGVTITCTHWFVPTSHEWKTCRNCGLIEPN